MVCYRESELNEPRILPEGDAQSVFLKLIAGRKIGIGRLEHDRGRLWLSIGRFTSRRVVENKGRTLGKNISWRTLGHDLSENALAPFFHAQVERSSNHFGRRWKPLVGGGETPGVAVVENLDAKESRPLTIAGFAL
jgi:hypothetical protein